MQWQAEKDVEPRVDHQREPPAELGSKDVADRPEEGRGEATEQREIRDRSASAMGRNLDEGGERGIVKRHAHAEAHDGPAREVDGRMRGCCDDEKGRRAQYGAYAHHQPGTLRIDRLTDRGGNEARGQQTNREAGKNEGAAPSRIRGDGGREDTKSIERRSPSHDLRDA